MTEGKSDYYLLRYYQDFVEASTDGRHRIHFLPGTGSGTLQLPVQLYIGWGSSFVVLLDSDRAGATAKAKYTDQFGILVSDRIINMEDASEHKGTKAIESLLELNDQLAFQQLIHPGATTFNKKRFAQGVEYAFSKGEAVVISDAADSRLSTVMTNLRAMLGTTQPGR